MCGMSLAKPKCIVDVADRSLGGFCPRVPCIGLGVTWNVGQARHPGGNKKNGLSHQ